MDGFDNALSMFRIFIIIMGLGVAFLIYYTRKKAHSMNVADKSMNNYADRNNTASKNIAESGNKNVDSYNEMDNVRNSLKIVPIIIGFFAAPALLILVFFIGVGIFKSVALAAVLVVLCMMLILYLTRKKLMALIKK